MVTVQTTERMIATAAINPVRKYGRANVSRKL
jgi:hypothetical protein